LELAEDRFRDQRSLEKKFSFSNPKNWIWSKGHFFSAFSVWIWRKRSKAKMYALSAAIRPNIDTVRLLKSC
jgi:hypothetical protein